MIVVWTHCKTCPAIGWETVDPSEYRPEMVEPIIVAMQEDGVICEECIEKVAP